MNCKNCGKAVNQILCDECFDNDEIFNNVVIQPLLDDERDAEYADNPEENYGENGIGHIAPTDGYWWH